MLHKKWTQLCTIRLTGCLQLQTIPWIKDYRNHQGLEAKQEPNFQRRNFNLRALKQRKNSSIHSGMLFSFTSHSCQTSNKHSYSWPIERTSVRTRKRNEVLWRNKESTLRKVLLWLIRKQVTAKSLPPCKSTLRLVSNLHLPWLQPPISQSLQIKK